MKLQSEISGNKHAVVNYINLFPQALSQETDYKQIKVGEEAAGRRKILSKGIQTYGITNQAYLHETLNRCFSLQKQRARLI